MKLIKKNSTVIDAIQLIQDTSRAAAWNDSFVKLITGAILAGGRDSVEILAEFLTKEVEFMPDPAGLQIVRNPRRLIIDGVGNCVDLTVLLAAIGYRLGLPVSFMVASYDGQTLTHIYPKIDGDVFDVTMFQPGGGGLQGFEKNKTAPALSVLEFY